MAAPINTGSHSKALWPGVNHWVGLTYEEYEPQYKGIFDKEMSDKNFEEDVSAYGTGLAVLKPEGEDIVYDTMAQGFTKRYVHDTYALGFVITEEAMEDNQYMALAEARSKQLARSLRETKENVAANVLNRAFNSSYTGADVIELCATDHKFARGGTFKNELSTAADLSEASLEQMSIDIMDFKDDAGRRISIKPRKLIIPKELCFEAERILKSTLQNESSNNALNALKSKGVLPEGYVINQYLSDANAFFIKTSCPNGLKHLQRRGVVVKDETDFNSSNVKFKASERYVFGWTDPRGIFGSPGA